MKLHAFFVTIAIGLCLLIDPVDLQGQAAQQGQVAQEGEEQAEFLTKPIADAYRVPDGATRQEQAKVIKLRNDSQLAISNLMRSRSTTAQANDLAPWLNGFVIPMMTQTDEQTLSQLGNMRATFFRAYVRDARNVQLRNTLFGVVIPAMQEIVQGNYHPACRVNAMVLLGELNVVEGSVRSSSRSLPELNPALLAFMVNSVESTDLPQYLRVPALAGIERHAAARTPGTNRPLSEAEANRISQNMANILALDPEVEENKNTDPDLIYWMKRRAVRILGLVGRTGPNNQFADSLYAIVTDSQLDPYIRTDAVSSYSMLRFGNNAPDLKKVLNDVADMLAGLARGESDFIDQRIREIEFNVKFLDEKEATERKKDTPNDPNVGQDADGASGGPNQRDKQDVVEILPEYQRERVRRRIKHSAYAVRVAIAGVPRDPANVGLSQYIGREDAESKQALENLLVAIDQLMKQTDVFEPEAPDPDDEDAEEPEPREITLAAELQMGLKNSADAIIKSVEAIRPEEAPPVVPVAPGEAADSGSSEAG